MKFLYEYRTRDNARHVGAIRAANRDAAFAALKAQGIRPGSVSEAPGFLNKLLGKGKRWLAIAILAATVAALALTHGEPPSALDAPERRQVVGDMGVIEKGIRNGWSDVFADEGERFLASFAIPGVPAGLRNTTEEEIRRALARDCRLDAAASPPGGDGIEARQIRAMVEGMKQELRDYLADGGTIIEYGQALVARQEEELRYYASAKNAIDSAARSGMDPSDLEALWERQNAELRCMGIKLVPLPE